MCRNKAFSAQSHIKNKGLCKITVFSAQTFILSGINSYLSGESGSFFI